MEKLWKKIYNLRKNLPFELHPYFYAAIFNHEITKNALLELQEPNYDVIEIANLINAHQEILDKKLNNTPNGMIHMMNAAKNAGLLAVEILGIHDKDIQNKMVKYKEQMKLDVIKNNIDLS